MGKPDMAAVDIIGGDSALGSVAGGKRRPCRRQWHAARSWRKGRPKKARSILDSWVAFRENCQNIAFLSSEWHFNDNSERLLAITRCLLIHT